jgi:hypothetical protein
MTSNLNNQTIFITFMQKNITGIFILILLTNALSSSAQQTVGLFTQNAGSLNGYVLFAPITSTTTYLIDKCGYLVHSWNSTHRPGQSVYLLENGALLRPGSTGNTVFNAGGNGGIIEKFDWNSSLLWSYTISTTTECQHHDIRQLPNGNVLAIVWELKTVAQATAAGRNPALLGNSLWSEKIVELQPVGTNGANIVWEWHAWDHLVQDFDQTKANYDTISEHPELINLNFGATTMADWLHCNALDYNPDLDQIILSSHNFSEIWILDHSTTTAEAASHTGGVHGKGGDLLYRWGNAASYNRGTTSDKKLFGQHNPHWIENGFNDAGNIMIFNNGLQRPAGNYSSIEIIAPPIDVSGNYSLVSNLPYQPDSSYWEYTAPVPTDFFGQNISGAQRLSNGNTIICEGPKGNFFEIDTAKNTVWRYVNPVVQSGPVSQGTTPTMNSVFRCTLYEPAYAGLTGQTLIPGNPIELNPLSYNCTMLTGLNELSIDDHSIQITNPFSHEILIKCDADRINVTATLLDVTGRTVVEFKNINLTAHNFTSLKLKTNLSQGVYFFLLNSSTQNKAFKLIHQQ